MVTGLSLHLLELGGSVCCALKASTVLRGKGDASQEEPAFAYLLSPADASVWLAIESWARSKVMVVEATAGYTHGTPIKEADMALAMARYSEGEEHESDMLARAIVRLMRQGQLEVEVGRQLEVEAPMYVSVVETPMMLKSLQCIDVE